MRVLVYEKKNVSVGEKNSLGQKYLSNITVTCIAHLSSDHYQDYFTLRMSAIKIVLGNLRVLPSVNISVPAEAIALATVPSK